MVRHLRFLLLLAPQPLYQVDYLRARNVYCASDSLRIPRTLAWSILGVPCPQFLWLPLPRGFVVVGLLHLRRAFLVMLACHVPGVLWLPLWRACLERLWHPLFLEVVFFAGASLARLINFWSSDRMHMSDVLSDSHILLFDGHLLLVLLLLSVGGGEEIKFSFSYDHSSSILTVVLDFSFRLLIKVHYASLRD